MKLGVYDSGMNEQEMLTSKVEFALREYGYQTDTGPGAATLQVAVTMFLADALRVAAMRGAELSLSKAVPMAEQQAAARS